MQRCAALADETPRRLLYLDLTPGDVNLGHPVTRQQQAIICALQEGSPLALTPTKARDSWLIRAHTGVPIGALSAPATAALAAKGIHPAAFTFQPGEVTLRALYHHDKLNDVTGDLDEDWFVPIPQIRLRR